MNPHPEILRWDPVARRFVKEPDGDGHGFIGSFALALAGLVLAALCALLAVYLLA